MLLDNHLIKLAIIIERAMLSIILVFPFEKIGGYSRGILEKQLIGDNWLLNGMWRSLPDEARRRYLSSGRIYLACIIFVISQVVGGLWD